MPPIHYTKVREWWNKFYYEQESNTSKGFSCIGPDINKKTQSNNTDI